jgi:2-oxo-4-hydroxy-4-carboxy--5-ureidoimidazoline (OHCU) decarboxylase
VTAGWGSAPKPDDSGAGLTRLADENHRAFRELSSAYRHSFGFPLIDCVRDPRNHGEILRQGLGRVPNSSTPEHTAELIEIAKIAKIAGRGIGDRVVGPHPIHTRRTQRFEDVA